MWDEEPIRLLATSTFMAHDGSGAVTAVPEEAIPVPAFCTLYRDDLPYDEDSCEVLEGPPEYHPKDDESPWHIRASFNGSGWPLDDPRRWSEKSVIAFDSTGQTMGEWDGAEDYHPDHSRTIE